MLKKRSDHPMTAKPLSVILVGVAMLAGAGCKPAATSGAPPAASTTHGLDVAGMDRSINPGDDFFAYANGAWLKSTEIPPDRSAYGVGAMLVELTNKRTADLMQEVASGGSTASAEARKVGDYYAAFMDEPGIEKKGLQPLQATLDAIAAIKDRKGLARMLGSMLRTDVDALNATNFYTDNLFGLWVAQDLNDPGHYSPFLLQGGLGMPDRDYYLDSSPQMAAIRMKYQPHLANVLKLANIVEPDAKAARIVDLEKRMASVHGSRVDSADVTKGNNHWTRHDLEARAPGLDWQAYLAAAGLERQGDFVVWHPAAMTGLSALTASQPLQTWKDYLTARVLEHASPFLPKAFVQEQFEFYGKTLSGTPMLRDRWKRAVDATSAALGEAVGKLYVERYFSPAEKARAEAMVRNLIDAFGTRIDRLDWMAPETKAKAKAKLATLKVGVGYPDRWLDYSGLSVVAGDALGNAQRAEQFEYHRNVAKLGQAIDRSEWVMTPQTVNAVNLPLQNALNFPAAILQPPYFDPNADGAHNYGSMGAIIGHEISHSFDDQGSQFDAQGKLSNWWTKNDLDHFRAAGEALAKQFDMYRAFPDLAVNGHQTLSENIADIAGLLASYDAYKLSLNGKQDETRDSFTGDQRFFISFGQSWRSKSREAQLRKQIATDGHAPEMYRADTVRNMDPWYDAFSVHAPQKLYLAQPDRVHVW
jgi:predicted metalloendopeptidase